MLQIKAPEPVDMLLATLETAGCEAWVVGGCVRDSLMGHQPHDWDVTTAATPAELLQLFPGALQTGITHGTVTVLTSQGPVEITTFRAETGYADHRHPDAVQYLSELEGDLARRDFTVNAMAWNPRRGLRDLFDGQTDLRNGIIRCVGDPDRRFSEDALRILRALRFAARFGFRIERTTAEGMEHHAAELSYVSSERIYAELRGLLRADAAYAEAYPMTICTAVRRLRLPESKHALRTWRQDLGDEGLRTLLRWCRENGRDVSGQEAYHLQLTEDEQLPLRALEIKGEDLISLGITAGPEMGKLLNRLRIAVMHGELANERDALERQVRIWGNLSLPAAEP